MGFSVLSQWAKGWTGGESAQEFLQGGRLQHLLKEQALWVAVIPSGSLELMPSSLAAYFHYEWLFSRVCDAASLCTLWGLSADDFEGEDPVIRKLFGRKSQLEECDRGFCVKHHASLCLGWISSGFWAALTLNLELKWARLEVLFQMPVAATREEGCSKCYGHEREGVARSGKDGRNWVEIRGVPCSLFFEFRSELSEVMAGWRERRGNCVAWEAFPCYKCLKPWKLYILGGYAAGEKLWKHRDFPCCSVVVALRQGRNEHRFVSVLPKT